MVDIWRGKPIKNLTKRLVCLSGRNVFGRICVFHRGGGHKKRYRIIDSLRLIMDIPAFVVRIEHDPRRTSLLALLCYSNGILSYILATDGLKKNDFVISRFNLLNEINKGDSLSLFNIPNGFSVYNIENFNKLGGKYCRAGGLKSQISGRQSDFCLIKLPSGEVRSFFLNVRAFIGSSWYSPLKNKKILKAGRARWLNNCSIVRGVAMNPVDHPHGGNTAGGRPSVSPWARHTKGMVTRNKRKSLTFIYRSRKLKYKNEV